MIVVTMPTSEAKAMEWSAGCFAKKSENIQMHSTVPEMVMAVL
jgi:hypothetical protein